MTPETKLGRPRRGFVIAIIGVVAALPVVGVAAKWVHAAFAHPMINDITTDLDDPPVFRGMPDPADYPGERFASKQRAAYPDIEPLYLARPAAVIFDEALTLARARGWEIISADATERRIEATERSRVFGFIDEVVLQMTETDDGTRVDMRSRSRLGRSDLGVNAARIRAFLADLETRLRTL